jgi:DNA-binding NarL/FixJ family response regulator
MAETRFQDGMLIVRGVGGTQTHVTPSEYACLRDLAAGMTFREVALCERVVLGTVTDHVKAAMKRTGYDSPKALMAAINRREIRFSTGQGMSVRAAVAIQAAQRRGKR